MTFMACAAMLASAVALNSCKSNDPIGSFEGEAEVVKTEFAISLPGNVVGGPRKMPADKVQIESTQFNGINSILLIPFATADSIKATDTRLGDKNIRLDPVTTGATAGRLGTNSNAKVYTDVAIPLTTASFLFYGKSAATGSEFEVGSMKVDTATSHTTPAGFKFELDSILTKAQYDAAMAADGNGGKLMAYLTTIANAEDENHKKWKDYPNTGDSVAYYKMFQTFKSLKDLSSFQVERVLSDLYRSLEPLNTSIATAIKAAINNATYASLGTNDSVKLIDALTHFPQELRIPEGAVSTKWNDADAFVAGEYSASRTYPTRFVYPAQLWYFANSTIKTSNKSQKDKYNDSNTWAYITGEHTDGAAVNTLTRAVVLEDSIQYAVARFDAKVKLANTSLEDNSDLAEGKATAVDVTGGFPVTAIFVGGQKHVNYAFQPAGTSEYTIYDSIMSATMTATTSYSAVNHTLVLETAAGINVRVAVEMLNDKVDFYGFDKQLIPKGSKFYVVAELPAAQATETGTKVFKQDYTTTAGLNLKDLRKAYNTIPDLRTPKLEIGFAVSLSWQSGHSYDDIDLGI